MARLAFSALTIGVPLTISSVATLRDPLSAYARFGVPSPPPSSLSPFVYAKCARDVALGLVCLGLKLQGNDSASKLALVVTGLVGLADGYIVWLFGGEKFRNKAWGHWIPSAAIVLGAIVF